MTDASFSLGQFPEGDWVFDAEVARIFDDLLARSIPDYETMRQLVFEVGRRFVRPGTDVVDLGCSGGEALAPLVRCFGDSVRYVGVEAAPAMLEVARHRYKHEIEAGVVAVFDLDLCEGYPEVGASLTLAVLTLQFAPVECRLRILRDAYERTVAGGALILVEKVATGSGPIGRLLTELHEEVKRSNGFAQEEIDRKRLSLEGVLVPAVADRNVALLRQAGFHEVECFWRCLNFAAWVAVKVDPA